MSDLTFNKIAGAVLATGLAIFLLREASDVVFHKEHPEKAGYAIAVQEETEGGAAEAEVAPDWGTVLPAANIEAGKAITAKCASCHTFEQGGANGTGPNLFGTLGKKPGTHGGFAYSSAMVDYGNANPVWDYDKIDAFLKAPQKDIAGTKMTFVGLKKQEDRIAVIAYLHSLGSTLPIPAPKPAAAAEAPAADAAPAEGAAPPAGEAPTTEATPTAPATAANPH
ncbi:cytochrome c family protein [Caulobacter segnis]|uniref:c-type cytochrome n=1 Tax=Caulobacter segnis TaxID=88688 RepID=UPI00240F192F|nr:cytochrome c family protein [Caulobacter segnis]MDG2520219.1 cytochrome c family protein [Caulobacter segnis]